MTPGCKLQGLTPVVPADLVGTEGPITLLDTYKYYFPSLT
jgi:hypothetical protein